ncbi:MAG: ABC transporter permease subunit [Bacillota bacterium]|nr:ABC transporter permease subunit [Bacillota bacterium]
MFKLINNEMRKLIRRTKTLVVFVCFIALVGLVCYGSYKNDQNNQKYQSTEYQIQNMEESVNYMKNDLNRTGLTEEEKKSIEQNITQTEEQITKLKAEKDKPYDYKEDLNSQIESIDKTIASTANEDDKKSLQLQKERLQKQLELGISPKDEGRLNGLSYINELVMILGAIFLAAGIAVFSSDMVSGEYTPATMKFLLIQPVSRGKVLFAKYITILVSVLAAIFSVEGLSYLLMGIKYGFGNSSNPVITGAKYMFDLSKTENGVHPMKIVPGSQYLSTAGSETLKVLLFQILFMLAVTSFVFMISTVVKSSMVSMAVSTIVIITLSIVQNIPGTSKLAPYFFTLYGNAESLLSGQMAQGLQMPKLTPTLGITVLLVWTAVSYLIAHVVFVKKDILI